MTDYQIQPNTRHCAATGRELRAGERFYSVLSQEGGKLVRRDYAAEAWRGPPEGAFSFWSGRVPAGEQTRKLRIDDDLLADCFQRLEGQPEPAQVNFRYVVALLLMRRKRFKFDEARVEDGHEVLRVRCARTGARYDVVNPCLTEDEMIAVQDEVFKVLGWE
ncbi:MAG TPA: hypothetical protein VFW33_23320 [Gemmataceae bacterium]|nr:hypothetical protein [Gemmataceae bacterium]